MDIKKATRKPRVAPTVTQTVEPTVEPTVAQTVEPTVAPTVTPKRKGVNGKPKVAQVAQVAEMIQTEDTGKQFEMAICVAFNIPYNGPYKYGMETAEKLKPRLSKLKELFPKCIHTAKNGSRYDYTSEEKHLSAKSTKKTGKVAPQVIGQSTPKKFCELMGIEYTTDVNLKEYIQKNITSILPVLVSYTFDCPTVYYNEKQDSIRYITLDKKIDWEKYECKWTCEWDKWENSSTLKIGKVSLVEFQFHTTRKNMAIRWCYENFLTLFSENLSIVKL